MAAEYTGGALRMEYRNIGMLAGFLTLTNRRDPIPSRAVYKNPQLLFLLLPVRLFAQSLHGELSGCDRFYCPYEHSGYPCEHRHMVSLFELPAKTDPVVITPEAKSQTANPLADRLAKRMEPIISKPGFTQTNTVPFDMAPGLAPKSR